MRFNEWPRSLVAALALAAISTWASASTPDEVVAARKAAMKEMGEIGKAFDAAVADSTDVKPMAVRARRMVELGHDIPAMFPPGTETAGETRAWAEVWSDRATFERAAGRFAADVVKLEPLASAGDGDGFAAQWDVVGNDCAACHHSFKRH